MAHNVCTLECFSYLSKIDICANLFYMVEFIYLIPL